jgi:hypothetical protein
MTDRSDKWVLGLVPEMALWQHRHGIISDRQMRLYKLLWVWCAPHFSDLFGAESKRSALRNKCGREAVDRRQARALKWRERIMAR